MRARAAVLAALLMLTACGGDGQGDADGALEISPAGDPQLPAAMHAAATPVAGELVLWSGRLVENPSTVLSLAGGRYDVATGEWRRLPDAPVAPRYRHTAFTMAGEAFFWGGVGPGEEYLADGAAYSVAGDRWRPIAPAPEGRSDARAFVAGGEVLVGGGRTSDGGSSDVLLRYDPSADAWSSTVMHGGPFLDWLLVDGAAYLLRVSEDAETLFVSRTNPATGAAAWTLPIALPEELFPEYVGLVRAASGVEVLASNRAETAVTTIGAGGDVLGSHVVDADLVAPSMRLDTPGRSFDFEVGGALYSFGERYVSRFAGGDGARVGELPCRDGAVVIPAEPATFLRWGGRPCGGEFADVPAGDAVLVSIAA